jgi:hypothetical protein
MLSGLWTTWDAGCLLCGAEPKRVCVNIGYTPHDHQLEAITKLWCSLPTQPLVALKQYKSCVVNVLAFLLQLCPPPRKTRELELWLVKVCSSALALGCSRQAQKCENFLEYPSDLDNLNNLSVLATLWLSSTSLMTPIFSCFRYLRCGFICQRLTRGCGRICVAVSRKVSLQV